MLEARDEFKLKSYAQFYQIKYDRIRFVKFFGIISVRKSP